MIEAWDKRKHFNVAMHASRQNHEKLFALVSDDEDPVLCTSGCHVMAIGWCWRSPVNPVGVRGREEPEAS